MKRCKHYIQAMFYHKTTRPVQQFYEWEKAGLYWVFMTKRCKCGKMLSIILPSSAVHQKLKAGFDLHFMNADMVQQ